MSSRLTKKTVYLLICIFCFFVILFLLPTFGDLGDFYNNLWGPANLLLSQKSPYAIKQLFPNTNALWMPQVISAGIFLGLLEKNVAGKIWVLLNVVSLISILFLLAEKKPTPILLGTLFLGLILFPPLSTYFLFGQCSLICIFFLLMSIKVKSTLSSLLILIGLGKPQLGMLFGIGFFYVLWKQGKNTLLIYLTQFVGWMVLLLIPFYALFPHWFPAMVSNFQSNSKWDQPTLINALYKGLGNFGLVVWFVIFVFSIGLTIYLWTRFQKSAAILTFAITLIISPYLWSWDYVLLFPLLIHFSLNGSKFRSILTLLALAIVDIVFWSIRLNGPISDYQNWPIPMIILGCLALIQLMDDWNFRTKLTTSVYPKTPR